jgi:hypothetical protein
MTFLTIRGEYDATRDRLVLGEAAAKDFVSFRRCQCPLKVPTIANWRPRAGTGNAPHTREVKLSVHC